MAKTIIQQMAEAIPPWFSIDATEKITVSHAPQEQIDRCLCCRHESAVCDYCDGRGNVRMPNKYDPELLQELLKLRICSKEMAKRMGVSRRSLFYYLRKLEAASETGD